MAQIKRFGVLQTAKVAGLLYLIGAAVIFIPAGLFTMLFGSFMNEGSFLGGLVSGVGVLLLPVIYGILGFVAVAIGCAVYNLIAGVAGGIEIDLE